MRAIAGAVCLFAMCLGIGWAQAADIAINYLDSDENERLAIITIDGELHNGDEKEFAERAIGLDGAFVLLDSPGGSLYAGMEIGKAIRLKGFRTLVPDGSSCESACALIWIAGSPIYMEENSSIGFHAAWRIDQGGKPSSVGNAMVGAYLTSLGFGPRVVAYATTAQPDEMQYLSFDDAVDMGIPVRMFGEEPARRYSSPLADGKRQSEMPRTATPAYEPPPSFPSSPPASSQVSSPIKGGEWIQTHSRPTLEESIALAGAQQALSPVPASVYRYQNGWYAVVLGPFEMGVAASFRDVLLAAGAIPEDSLITNGKRFMQLAWSSRASTQPELSLEQRAISAVGEIYRSWSMPNDSALSSAGRLFEDRVEYYGKPASRAQIMREKRQFAERWPERSYVINENSVTAYCSSGAFCRVSGIVTWRTYSPRRNVTSHGTASFEYVLSSLSPARVRLENSEVVTRSTVRGRLGGRPQASAGATAPRVPELFRIVEVSPGDTLKIRTGAGTRYPVVAEIPPGARGIAVAACRDVQGFSIKWCRVAWQGHTGWSSACCLAGERTGRRPD